MLRQQNALCLLTAMAWISGGVLAVQAAEVPTDNPIASHYKDTPDVVPDWIGSLPWNRVVNIRDFKGDNDTRLVKAQQTLDVKGGVAQLDVRDPRNHPRIAAGIDLLVEHDVADQELTGIDLLLESVDGRIDHLAEERLDRVLFETEHEGVVDDRIGVDGLG